jgi:glutamate carboxypeptidase
MRAMSLPCPPVSAVAVVLAAVFCGASAGASGGGGLTAVERRLARHVDEREKEGLDLLERAVNVNSGTMNFAGVRAVGELFREPFTRLGFTVRLTDGSAFGRAGHFLATRAGKAGAPKVVLIGHLDTVFEKDSPFQRFERLPGDPPRAKGPGTTDMKGGDVILLTALQALAAERLLDRLDLRVVLMGDEEDSGTPLALARADLLAAAEGADVALGFEDGDGRFENAVVARRSASAWTLRVKGRPAHSSQIFRDGYGDGAIFELARILDGFRRDLSSEANLTFNPGVVLGGTAIDFDRVQLRGTVAGKDNVIAGDAVATGDLRTLSPEQHASVKARMQAIVAAHLPETSAEITFDDGYPPMAPTPGNHALLALFDETSRDLGFGPVGAVDPRQAGAADISFVATKVKRALDALGLKGTGGHTAEETADLSTFPKQAKRVAVLLARIADGR